MEAIGRAPELEAADAMSGLVAAMLLEANEAGAPVTAVMLARESQYPHILASMKKVCNKQNGTHKHQFQIPLRLLFTKALSSVSIEKPLFTDQKANGSVRVSISMVVGDRNHRIYGDFSHTSEEAETSAINKAIVYLKESERLMIVDISAQKAKALTARLSPLLHKVTSASRLMDSILWKWRNCLDKLSLVQKYAQACLQNNWVDPRPANSVLCTMRLMKGAAGVHLSNLENQLLALRFERDRYLAACRAQQLTVPERKAYFDEVDTLSLFLQWLGLQDCQYSSQPSGNGLYIGSAQLCLHSNQIRIEAKEPKRSVTEAHNAAALEAVCYLEEAFKVEVVGSDHNAYVEAEQLVSVFEGLSEEFSSLTASMLHFWDDTLAKLTNFKQQLNENGNDTPLKRGLVHRLEVASAECNKSFKLSAAKFGLLN